MGILVKNNVVFGSTPPVDNIIQSTSQHPVQNSAVFAALATKADKTYATQTSPGLVRMWTTTTNGVTTLHIATGD